jgi:NADH-quinone oxidoreductase subunit N
VLLVDIQYRPKARVLGGVAGSVLVAAFGLSIWQKIHIERVLDGTLEGVSASQELFPFSQVIALDPTSIFARFVILVVTGLGIAAGWRLFERLGRRAAEALALVLLSAAGFSLMASSLQLVMVFLGLEIGSIALYVLAGITRERVDSDEAAMKYFLLGSVASAIFIYGAALVFAGTGELNLISIQRYLPSVVITQPGVLLIGIAMLIVGLAFKISAAPFHSWAPDVYQGAPAGIVGYMAAAAKIGGFAALTRVLFSAFPSLSDEWAPLVAALAAFSMVLGALLASVQDDVRRLLAYSGVAHAGFILSGVVSGGPGAGEIWFYLAVYTVQLVGAFGVVAAVAGATSGRASISSFNGLARRMPFLATSFAVLLLGMAGLPLTSGFVAKFGVFQDAWLGGFQWLVIVGVLASVIGFYFYLKVIVAMFMQDSDDGPVPTPAIPTRWALGAAAVVTIALGLFPEPLLSLARDAIPL